MSSLAGLTASEALALGDSLAIDEQFDDAADAYAAGLAVLASTAATTGTVAPADRNDSVVSSEEEEPAHVDPSFIERFRLLSHRSEAFYRLGRFAEAAEDACAAREMSVTGLRGGEREAVGLRYGKALYQLGQYESAKQALEQVVRLGELNQRSRTGACVAAKDWIARCDEELRPPVLESARLPPLQAETPSAPTISKSALTAPVPASSNSQTSLVQPPKYQYYQNDKVMTISIMEPNVRPENLQVEYADATTIRVVLSKQGQEFVVVSGHLFDEVDVAQCRTVLKDEKVLIKLKKKTPNKEWYDLFDKKKKKKTDDAENVTPSSPAASVPATAAAPTPTPTPTNSSSIPRPYTSAKNWDKIEKEVKEEEEKEIPEGDAAAMKLFQQIYASASEDTRRAMIKSYQTSGGTVLSTNWDEVSKKDYEKERTAPKGQEWKTWEGDKLS